MVQRSKLWFGLAASAVFLIVRSSFGAFAAGDLVILSTADSGATAGQVTLRDYAFSAATGGFSTTATLHPVAGLVLPGTNDHDGLLRLSTDGKALVFGGYQAAVGTTGVVASSAPRAIGAVDSNFNTTITPIPGYTGVSLRSVVATDATHYWTAGDQGTTGVGGQYYVDASGPSPTATQINAADARGNRIEHGQLWSVSSSAGGGSKVGVGLPTSAAATSLAMGDNGGALVKSDVTFLDLDGNGVSDTAYSTDGKNLLGKWSFNGSTWSQTGSWTGDKTYINNINGLQAYVYNGTVQLLAVTQNTTTTGGQLFGFTDANGISGGFGAAFANTKPTPLFAEASGTIFRGLAIVPEPGTAALVVASTLLVGRRCRGRGNV